MPRYIDADALGIGYANPKVFNSEEYARGWNSAIEIINSAPTVSPDEVRGVWKWVDKGVRAWSCSCCGTPLNHIRQFASFEKNELPNYCPNCGAKMEVAE